MENSSVSKREIALIPHGWIEEDKLDQFNLPCYAPAVEEVKQMIRAKGSFSIRKFEIFTVDWAPSANIEDGKKDANANIDGKKEKIDKQKRGSRYVAMSIRVVAESVFNTHFGEEVIDDLFERFAKKIRGALGGGVDKGEYTNMVISFTKTMQ
ncbi:7-methylxanthosine synthase 1-like [Pistacia vera]|uniref:7-methylxanthosine synthase 1-like n=1 Tax=Pistacia vera TaxID=55513 RepID=UPI001263521F|nr:7-methylxanthosine synthase 1-like [Pistacia vera]